MRQPMSKEERHAHILQTARLLFQTRGYDAVTIADVIKESNVARGTFYLHFDSLESLLVALFDEVVDETWHRIDPILSDLTISLEDCTLAVIHAVLWMFHQDKLMGAAFASGGGQAFVRRKQAALYDKLTDLLVAALQRRHHRELPNIRWTASMLIALVSEMAQYTLTHVSDAEYPQFEQTLTEFVVAGLERHINLYVGLAGDA